MYTEALYINDQLVDLAGPSQIALTKQFNNIAELQDRQGDFTNTFNLPLTPRNREVLENANLLNSATLVPYRNNTARYIVNGSELVREGTATLIRCTPDAYVVQITSGNVSFFGAFTDMKLSELIGSRWDHTNDFAAVLESRNNISGYIYPLIDWFNADSAGMYQAADVNVEFLLPCIFVKSIFDLVDELTGFTSFGRMLELPTFQNLLLTPSLMQRSTAAQSNYNVFVTGESSGSAAPMQITFDTEATGFFDNLYQATEPVFGYMTFNATVQITNPDAFDELGLIRFRILRNSGAEVFFEAVGGFVVFANSTVETYAYSVSVNRLFSPSDIYEVQSEIISAPGVTFTSSHKWEFKLVGQLPYGSLMPVGELFENITVKQVYQDVMNMFAGIPAANSFQQRIRFGLFNEVSENVPNAIDWSGKFHRADTDLSFKYGKYAQTNYLRYSENDTVPYAIGDSSFSIDDATLPDTAEAVRISAVATEEEIRFQGVAYPRIKAINSSREFTGVGHRYLVLDRRDTGYSHTYTDGDSEEQVNTAIPYARFEPLKFANLAPEYYGTLFQILRKAKNVNAVFKLSPQDFQNFDPFTPIYLDVHSQELDATGYFYVSAINNYVNGFASVVLVRL